ncbi:IS200/IS605 family transposase, partial [Sutterella wadsworthensis]|uniref:IS200/IS605 family transposase n=1 Tax=Sutterella wadsworthensis TaxID=40545 RepID=UPI003AB9BB00
ASAEKVCGDFGACLREFNGERNHVHLLVSYPPKVSISSLVNSLKGVTSRILRNRFPELETSNCKGKLWLPSYFAASCGGAPLEKLKTYIESQNRPD